MSNAPITGLNELVLEVLDLDRAAEFYGEALGLARFHSTDDRVWFLAGSARIGLWRPQVGLANGRGGVHVHYAFRIDESGFDDFVNRLESHGVRAELISFADEGRGRSLYVTDPDGNVVEFWTHDVATDTGETR